MRPFRPFPRTPPARKLPAGRILELAVLFGGIPALLATGVMAVPALPALWAGSGYCLLRLRLDGKLDGRLLGPARAPAGEWPRMLATFALASAALLAAVWALRPEALFDLPRRHPLGWALVLALYPPLSALPQELVFRAFFFHRYRPLFGDGAWLAVGSALAFGATHAVFRNWVAVALTVPAGLLFARSYQRHRQLRLVALQHALYGCMAFTIGLGQFLVAPPRAWASRPFTGAQPPLDPVQHRRQVGHGVHHLVGAPALEPGRGPVPDRLAQVRGQGPHLVQGQPHLVAGQGHAHGPHAGGEALGEARLGVVHLHAGGHVPGPQLDDVGQGHPGPGPASRLQVVPGQVVVHPQAPLPGAGHQPVHDRTGIA